MAPFLTLALILPGNCILGWLDLLRTQSLTSPFSKGQKLQTTELALAS